MKVLGIDIGGSGIKGAIVDTMKGKLLTERFRLVTPPTLDPGPMAATVKAVAAHFKWKGRIGCGFPSTVQHGVIRATSNLDQSWVGVNAETLFQKATRCRCTVVNDADSAAMAEMAYGAGCNKKGVVILITIGTGLGSALFVDGRLVPNLELGHVIVKGMVGERYASDAVREKMGLKWKVWARRFNEYLLRLEFLTRPDLFILGGGASKKFDKYKSVFTTEAKVVPARLQNHAGIIGAAVAAAKRRF